MNREQGLALYKRAKGSIPGGTQLLSKRPEMFLPGKWPAYYEKCKGIEVWDIDGNRYLDMTISGVGTCTLGYADDDVNKAVVEALHKGNMCTLNVPEEVELADLLLDIHPWAEMVRFARTGGEAMAIAVRIARAATGKDKIIFCGYHGWHDWYLSANLASDSALDGHLLPGLDPSGVPSSLAGSVIPFAYNDVDSFSAVFKKHRNDIAAVVMEPVRNFWPDTDFLKTIRQMASENNTPLIFDEVTSGFRMATSGIHMQLDIEPDIAVFAKAIGNGYPMAAIIGRSVFMNAAQRTFISSTYWTDKIGPVAALATLRKHKQKDVGAHLTRIGNLVQDGWHRLGKKHDINISVFGIPPLGHWSINANDDSQLFHTASVEKMLERGFLTSKAFYATYAHTNEHVESYLVALDETFDELVPALKEGRLSEVYQGPVAHGGFKRLT
jgi:glutamate-1-semialdehyde aminotransferase